MRAAPGAKIIGARVIIGTRQRNAHRIAASREIGCDNMIIA